MNSKKNLLTFIFVAITLSPLFSQTQNFGKKEVNTSLLTETWEPLSLGEDGKNVLNLVSFYVLKTHCSSIESVLLRLVNSNKYAVKVEWQLSPESPKVHVIVPAATDMQGSCPSVNDKNPTNLAISTPKTEEERQKIKEYFLSHLFVSQIKN